MSSTPLKTLITGSLISAGGMLALGIINYFVRRCLALNLFAEDFGFLYSVISLLLLCLTAVEFGTSSAGVILIAKHLTRGRQGRARLTFGTHFSFNLITGVLIVLALASLVVPLTRNFFHHPAGIPAFLLILPLVLATTLESSFSTCLTAMKAFNLRNAVLNIRGLVLLVVSLLFVKPYGLVAAALAFSISAILSATSAWAFLWWLKEMLPVPAALFRSRFVRRELFGLGAWVAVSNTGLGCMYYMGSLCLTWLSSLQEVALYNVALSIMQIVQSMVMVVPLVFNPIASEMLAQGDVGGLRRHCRWMTTALLALLPLVCLIGYFLSGKLVTILFSAKFIQAANIIAILWCGMLLYALAQIHFNVLNAGGKAKSVALYTAAGGVLNLILNICLIPRYGIVGAAWATALPYLGMAAASIFEFKIMANKLSLHQPLAPPPLIRTPPL